MRSSLTLVALALAVGGALLPQRLLAGDPAESLVPVDYQRQQTVGRLNLFVPTKPALEYKLRNDLVARLTSIRDNLFKHHGLGNDCSRIGQTGGLYRQTSRDSIDILVFPDKAALASWEATVGSALIDHHLTAYSRTIPLCLEDGNIPNEAWVKFCHELAHLYYSLTVFPGQPRWLNEGFALFAAYNDPHIHPMDCASYMDMLKRLKSRASSHEAKPVGDLLELSDADFGEEACDQSWVLVDFLMREAPAVLDEIVGAMRALDMAAWDDYEGIAHDMRTTAATLLLHAFGGRAKMQAAWDEHLDVLDADPDKRAKSRAHLNTTSALPPLCGIKAQLIRNKLLNGTRLPDCHLTGEVEYDGPRSALVNTSLKVGDGRGRWSQEFWVQQDGTLASGGHAKLHEYDVPTDPGDCVAVFTVEVKLQDGGTYHFEKTLPFR